MFEIEIEPRFCETDALRHISNTALPIWFESARMKIFENILPSLEVSQWPFIIAHIDVDFLDQIFLGGPVKIRTGISRIGSKSFTVYHEAWQRGECVATGSAVMVHFDYKKKETTLMPEHILSKLAKLLKVSEFFP